jgi:AcrR family transcriptional regulator
MKQTRARSKEAKDKQTLHIINVARDLFLEVGARGFSMRALANRLNMSQGNLYNYWPSKRDLWYAIIEYDFSEFEETLGEVVMSHEGDIIDLLEKLAYFYFDFARNNPSQYRMMFILPPPPAEKKGATEIEFEPTTISLLLDIIEQAITSGEFKDIDAKKLTLYLWTVVHGAVLVSHTILFDSRYETAVYGNIKEFQTFVVEQLRKQLELYLK